MGGKQGLGPDLGGELFGHRLSQGAAIRRTGSPTDLIQNDQTPLGRMFQDIRRLHHFDHKSREPLRQKIRRANPRKNTVHGPNGGRPGGKETPHLGQQDEQSGLTRIGAFSRGIGTGDNQHVPACIQAQVVRHELRVARIENRMSALFDEQFVLVGDIGPNPAPLRG